MIAKRLSTDPTAITALSQRIIAGDSCSAAEARELLEIEGGSPAAEALFRGAQAIRDRFVGRTLKCCSVVNVKAGNCQENCSYCAQASGSANVDYQKTKWLGDEDIAKAAETAAQNGAKALGLVAAWKGVKEGAQLDMVCEAIEEFSQNGKVRPDVNLGILESQHCADRIKQAGAAVYGHNLETARSKFDDICTSHSWEDRMKTISFIKQAGMGLCSGGIVGMGETREQRVEFMEQIRFIEPDMVPINFLNPIAGTKLGETPKLGADEALITLAVVRFMRADRNLMTAGGKELVLGERLHEVFKTGINAVMVGNYLTTLGTDPAYWERAAKAHGLRLAKEVTEIEDASAAGSCGSACGCKDG